MRLIVIVALAALVAACATSPTQLSTRYDHRTNTTSFVAKDADSDFVGTSKTAPKPVPNWYRYGHP